MAVASDTSLLVAPLLVIAPFKHTDQIAPNTTIHRAFIFIKFSRDLLILVTQLSRLVPQTPPEGKCFFGLSMIRQGLTDFCTKKVSLINRLRIRRKSKRSSV